MAKKRVLWYTDPMAPTPTNGGLFGIKNSKESEEVSRLKAELQVEKDRHHTLVQKAHRVEKSQSDKDAAAALALLETFEDSPAPAPKA